MIEIGRLCMKIAGREAGKKAVIVDVVDNKFVIIDGNVKRRKCNINHIELLPEKIDVKKGAATTEEVKKIFEEKGILEKHEPKVKEKRARKGGEKPKKIRPLKKKAPEAKSKKKSKKTEDEIVEEALKSAEATKSN